MKKVDVYRLIQVLRSLPGLRFEATNGVHIEMHASESSIHVFVEEPRKLTDEEIDRAIDELFML